MANRFQYKVYRLRNLPSHVDRLEAAELFASAFHDFNLTAADLHIFSLASRIQDHDWVLRPTKVATLMFRKYSEALASSYDGHGHPENTEWKRRPAGFSEPLILEAHFGGLTPLNDVDPSQHTHDCIVISGLASHPFGSWQPKGNDKTFMWIRDALPSSLSRVRFVLYGYDTKLVTSTSFQTVVDLSRSLIEEMKANGCGASNAKPLLFLAHSLGGVLLKQALVMLAGGNEKIASMLGLIRGVVFFGVPSQGMPISDLLSIAGDRPNGPFVKDLSDQSQYVANLEDQFSGISWIRRMSLFWVYETKTSPTVVRLADGSYSRCGPDRIMVTRESATRGRWRSNPSSTLPIDEDHSNMVKLPAGDHRIGQIISLINEICRSDQITPAVAQPKQGLPPGRPHDGPFARPQGSHDAMDTPSLWYTSKDIVLWDHDLILRDLRLPERDRRLDQIEEKFGYTFDWVFDNHSLGLTSWLRNGTGIYWISGKPGSGKSTLMKFLFGDPRTTGLLRNWKSTSRQIIANFFFHHRGGILQKSFHGLLQSLLSQIMESEPSLLGLAANTLEAKFQEELKAGAYGDLHSDVRSFFRICGITRVEPSLEEELSSLLSSSSPIPQLQIVFGELFARMTRADVLRLKQVLLKKLPELQRTRQANFADDEQRGQDLDEEVLEICRTELNWVPSPTLPELIKQWCWNMNLEIQIQYLLERANISAPRLQKQHIAGLTRRQRARDALRQKLHTDAWALRTLWACLLEVLKQEQFDLEICLLFDALDEYDGRPEDISEFLKDLTRTWSPRTKTRILFSSRPWPLFREEFGKCPGFRIHDHTQSDIYQYSIGSIPDTHFARVVLSPFVGEITRRARGVFLWVKLVMADLSRIATEGGQSSEYLQAKLRRALNLVPDELDDYYSAIVKRLPGSTRLETYILLECLCRSERPISLEDILRLIACSLSQTLADVERNWTLNPRVQNDSYLRSISGGLVDITPSGRIQLMHQTCKEWVEDPKFKRIILEDMAHMTWENGHSFLSKYHTQLKLKYGNFDESTAAFLYHSREAERTTGISQHTFLSQIPPVFYRATLPEINNDSTTAMSLAAYNCLYLYLNDCLRLQPDVIRQTDERLFSALLSREDESKWMYRVAEINARRIPTVAQDILHMGRFLLGHGFEIDKDIPGLELLMNLIWATPDPKTVQELVGLAITALQKSRSLGSFLFMTSDGRRITFRGQYGLTLLHISPPRLASWMLQNGAQANQENFSGQTPLDYVVSQDSVHRKPGFGIRALYHSCCVLTRHGAVLKSTPFSHWEWLLRTFQENGLDIRPLNVFSRIRMRDKLLNFFGRPRSVAAPSSSQQPVG
ncbi:hypothetical protein CONLIGDRAFT_472512 [Coniochaeta ligniaria NRRL 30616]|uniref:Nephrocystin 3-like N-terminal domain-containing protein n=1 Tax=Coniochaeta ligniaria NRRL 30616 TaxID=1408157 RepID=A0A1J7JFP8_9PEZI|nr:hypothetical protein CONLIGDRAFT_472512 [Coniochaeta ligniaria NRRL 30616]